MNRSVLRLLGPRRRISLWRALGPGAWFSVALWSVVALLALGTYRNPGFITRLTSAGGVGEAASLLFGVVSPALLPVVVAGVACVVLPLRLLREVRRAFRGRRRYGSHGYHDHNHGYHDGVVTGGFDPDDAAGALLGGGLLGGGLLGGVADAFDGDDGDGGGGHDGDE
ncbi:hypothetical protein C2R22_19455 [Salinigranum rubrum]|uniref:Uncharacterized protein n=1 Tax=Salinigranum rubrum TaxID=755307 RepID=A0A2I8VQX4_9EURY|nr:hypothetical protein [Salinigranum rubrum]AUV83549.1 hypothetical protein C2R22_19455 [Salinigranum rubrum]